MHYLKRLKDMADGINEVSDHALTGGAIGFMLGWVSCLVMIVSLGVD